MKGEMNDMKKKRIAIFVGILFFGIIVGTSSLGAEQRFLTLTSSPVGGDWYILGGALAEVIKKEIPSLAVTVTTGGGVANPSKLNSGKADIGFTTHSTFHEALQGTGPYKKKGRQSKVMGMLYLANIYTNLFLVRENNPVNSIEEIKDKKIPIKLVVAVKGSASSVSPERMLNEYGITFDDIRSWGGRINFVSYSEAASLIKDGHADGYCGPFTSAILELTVSRRMKLLPAKESVVDVLKSNFKYGKAVIPEGHWYFVKKDTPTTTYEMMIAVRKDLPEDLVYKITKAICAHPDSVRGVSRTYKKFSCEPSYQANRITGGPIHPGALRFYKEKGISK